jgi:hypothetical protein
MKRKLLAFLVVAFFAIQSIYAQSSDKKFPYYSTDYLTIIAIPQLATGRAFDANIIFAIFMEAVTGGVMNLEGDIFDHVKLCDIAFNKTDKKELSIAFGDNHPSRAVLYGKRLIVIFEDNVIEYILLDTSGKVIYDPGDKYTDDKSKWKEIEDIYIYAK